MMRFRYREDRLLPNGAKLPDIPVLNLAFVRRNVGKALTDSGCGYKL